MNSLRAVWSGFLEPRVQVVVLESAGLAEFVEFQRQRQALRRKSFRKMGFHDIEQAVAGRLLGGVAAPRAYFQDGVHEPRIARRAVGNAVLLARDGAHAHAAGWEHSRAFDAQRRHELREFPAKRAEAALVTQIGAVLQRHVRHLSSTNGHGGDGAAYRENWHGPVVLQPAPASGGRGNADEGANLETSLAGIPIGPPVRIRQQLLLVVDLP